MRDNISPFDDLPTLDTDRLRLRKLSLDDVDDLFAYARDPQMTRYVSWVEHASLTVSRSFIEMNLQAYEAGKGGALSTKPMPP